MLRAGVKKISQDRREAIKVWLNTLESFLEKSEWFAGDELSIADLSLLSSVASVKVRIDSYQCHKSSINNDCLSIFLFVDVGCELQ